jgi:hypothetical protein
VIQNAPPPQPHIPRIIEVIQEPTASIDMIEVALAAFGLTGVIMAAAVVAGLTAGALFIWYRRRHAVSTLEARGGHHDLFKTR